MPTPADALEIMEAPLLRWLYARRRPNQSFKIAFDQEIQRLYDEWDALQRKVADGTALPADVAAARPGGRHRRRPAAGHAAAAARTARWPRSSTSPPARPSRPCASCATSTRAPASPRSTRPGPGSTAPSAGSPPRCRPSSAPACATSPTPSCSARLDEPQRESLRLLLDGLDDHWSLDGLTDARVRRPEDPGWACPWTPSRPRSSRSPSATFFALLYPLLVGRDTGPRLPTLLLAVGAARVRKLLGG